jgi:hypothetical protein
LFSSHLPYNPSLITSLLLEGCCPTMPTQAVDI